MNQQREHVILGPEIPHVVLEAPCVDPDASASQHPHDIRPEPFEVHIHINFQRLVGFRRRPVIGKLPAAHSLYHGLRIVYMLIFPEFISVIPTAGFRKVHAETLAQSLHFLFRKAGILLEIPLIRHGVFPEHVQGRMQAVLFYGQDACHIGKGDILLILQKIPQEVQVLPLQPFRLLPFPHDTIPLIYQEYELLVRLHVNFTKRSSKSHLPSPQDFLILLGQFFQHFLFQVFRRLSGRSLNQELLHVQINHIITVQMLGKRFLPCYLQSREELPGVAAPAVIGSKHFKRHGLSEAPGPADTDIFFFCAKQLIGTCKQSCLIHINLRPNRFPKASVTWIQINSHKPCFRLSLICCCVPFSNETILT